MASSEGAKRRRAMGAESSVFDTYERARQPGDQPRGEGSDHDARDEHGWTVLMHAAERNDSELVRKLLASSADPNAVSTSTWGMFDAESNALQIARTVQDRLGVDRTAVIELLQSQAKASEQVEERARQLNDAARRGRAEAEARKRIEAARKTVADVNIRIEERRAEQEQAAQASNAANADAQQQARLQREQLVEAAAAAERAAEEEARRAKLSEERVARAQEQLSQAKRSPPVAGARPSADELTDLISEGLVQALDQAAVGLLASTGSRDAARTVSQVRAQAETDAGQGLSAEIRDVLRSRRADMASFFQGADANGDGTLDVEELAHALEKLGMKLSRIQKRQVMLFADADESGSIDWQEFLSSFDN